MRLTQRIPFRAFAVLTLALITGCAGSEAGRPQTEALPSSSPTAAAPSVAPATAPPPVEPVSSSPAGPDSLVTVIFRLAVAIDGRPRSFFPSAIHLVRTDLMPSWRPENRLAKVDPPVRSLGPDGEDWYAVDVPPGRYHLNVVSKWHFPTPRGVPPLLLELPPGDELVYAGSIQVNCRDQHPQEGPGSSWHDCDPPAIRTDETPTAARLSGSVTVEPAIHAARPLTTLTSPDLAARTGPWTLEPGEDEAASLRLHPFPKFHEAGERAAVTGGTALVSSLACGPMFAFCAAIWLPAVAVGAAADGSVEHHGNQVRLKCDERLTRELGEFDAGGRLRARLRERFAQAGRPLSEPASAPGAPAPEVVLRVAVLRIGVRGDTCVPGLNPFKLSDRYRADILASVLAVDGATGTVLYEEFLSNTEKLSPWDVLAGRGSLTPVGSRAACRRVKEYCPETKEAVLDHDLEPAIDAFADHVVRVLTGAGQPRTPPL